MPKNSGDALIAEYEKVKRQHPRATAFHFIAYRLHPDYSAGAQNCDELRIALLERDARRLGVPATRGRQ
jgi:hypothetical protein